MSPEDYKKAIITISKEALAELPAAVYPGKIKIIDKEEDVKRAVKDLSKEKIIGFDTETRPSFRKGQTYKVSLIQLSTKNTGYLFRTNIIGFPNELIEILENPEITKVGLSIHDDFHNINKITPITPAAFIDLQTFVKDYKISDNSLARIYAILFGDRISKSQRLTNWEAKELTESQATYAALDAYACIKIYEYLKAGKFKPRKSKYLTIPMEEEKEKTED